MILIFMFSQCTHRDEFRKVSHLLCTFFCLKIPSGLMCCAEDVVPRCALAVDVTKDHFYGQVQFNDLKNICVCRHSTHLRDIGLKMLEHALW